MKVNEAKVVYQMYSRDDFARDNNHNGTLTGPSLNRVYKFVVQVRARDVHTVSLRLLNAGVALAAG